MTSTPNGIEGEGKFFYEYWSKAQSSDVLFEPINPGETNNNLIYEKFTSNSDEIMKDETKNSFVSIKYYWKENPIRDEKWYNEQCRELNFDSRRIGQEIDLVFIGSKYSLFSDETLSKLQKSVRQPIKNIQQRYNSTLKLYQEIDPSDYYIIGCDTAASMEGCFSALQIFSFKDFKQVGELAAKFGPEHYYAQVIEDITYDLIQKTGGRVILTIENNTIGKTIVEH